MKDIGIILSKLPLEMQREIDSFRKEKGEIEELKLRIGSPVILMAGGREHYMNGKYGASCDSKFINDVFNSIVDHSVYAHQEELANGFITIEGGHRVGICGRTILDKGKIKAIKDISSLNIRRCREIIGVSDSLLPWLIDKKGRFLHTIIISPPKCGKTTLLRDIVRSLSVFGFRVGVCDERSEIAGTYRGIASFDLGHRTDVLDGCPKSEGMLMLIRGMSPDIIATDEIGKTEDIAGIEGALCAGVGLITTIHGNSYEDLLNSRIGSIIEAGIFKRHVFLSNQPKIGTIKSITDEMNRNLR